MKFNLNDAAVAERDFTYSDTVIPEDTQVRLVINIQRSRYGNQNYDPETKGLLTLTKDGDAKMLVLRLAIVGGPYNKQGIFDRLYIVGPSKEAIDITMSKLRAYVEGARGISPVDMSPSAKKKREFDSLEELEGLEFEAITGIEKGSNGFPDRTAVKRVLNDAAPPNGKTTAIVSNDKPKSGAASEKRKAAFAG